jgi:hypothetical protein
MEILFLSHSVHLLQESLFFDGSFDTMMAMALKSKISTPSRFARLRKKQQPQPISPPPHRIIPLHTLLSIPLPPPLSISQICIYLPYSVFAALNLKSHLSYLPPDSRPPSPARMDPLPPPMVQHPLLPHSIPHHPSPSLLKSPRQRTNLGESSIHRQRIQRISLPPRMELYGPSRREEQWS